eukprot:6490838-Amphidinium_carterae.2
MVIAERSGPAGVVSIKARFLKKRFSQSMDPESVYAGTPHMSSLKILLVMACKNTWDIATSDIKEHSFLHAPLTEEFMSLHHLRPAHLLSLLIKSSVRDCVEAQTSSRRFMDSIHRKKAGKKESVSHRHQYAGEFFKSLDAIYQLERANAANPVNAPGVKPFSKGPPLPD